MDSDTDAIQELVANDCKTIGAKSESENLEGPPDGFLFVLAYLDLQSRLTMERVSKSLREAVRDNPLVWQHLHVEHPASRKLTDDMLLTLVRRADGLLKSLSLTECLRTTETALEHILALNPGLEMLSVPGCTGITSEGIVKLVEAHSLKGQAKGVPGIKQVRIRGLYNITKEQLDRLHTVLQPVGHRQDPPMQVLPPQFYGNAADDLKRHDTRAIDVEVCPMCANVRVVYVCTRHLIDNDLDPSCEDPSCEGCTFCIPRCEECGCCITDLSYEESLCSDLVCTDCWYSLPKCLACNRAVCGRHAPEFIHGADDTFICEVCLLDASQPEFSF